MGLHELQSFFIPMQWKGHEKERSNFNNLAAHQGLFFQIKPGFIAMQLLNLEYKCNLVSSFSLKFFEKNKINGILRLKKDEQAMHHDSFRDREIRTMEDQHDCFFFFFVALGPL